MQEQNNLKSSDWEKKYLKYKCKYLNLKSQIEQQEKKTQTPNNMIGAGSCESDKNLSNVFEVVLGGKIKSGQWDPKTLLLDCVADTKMQTETVKQIDWMISNGKIKPNTKQLDITLAYAVFCGYYIIVEKLISLGANPLIRYDTNTLVDIATNLFFNKTAQVLIKHGAQSKNFYPQTQLVSTGYNLSNDPENLVESNGQENLISKKMYTQLKDKMSQSNKYSFEKLSRNIFKLGLKGKVELK